MLARPQRRRGRVALATALVSVCGVVAFARSLAFGFVYDDHWTVEGVPLDMHLGRLLAVLARGAGHELHIPDETRPSMVLSVWLDHALFGARPAGYHADSLLLYGVVCALVVQVILALTGRVRAAVVGGALFALAPLHTEVVCAINYREDLLAAIGVLVPMTYVLRPTTRPLKNEWVALVCWAVGLFAKESAVVLVLLLAACAIDTRARVRLLARRRLLLGLLSVLVVWAVWRWVLFARGDDVPRAHYGGIAPQLLAAARFIVRASATTLLPFRAAPEHAREGPASARWLVPLVVWIALIVWLARRRATRVAGVGLALASIAPLAASPVVGPANEMADRYLFLGVVGAGVVWGWFASRLPPRAMRAGLFAGGVVACVACQSSAAVWRSDRALWSAAIECAPSSPRAWVGLSRACRLDGDLGQADRAVDRALTLDPKFVTAHVTRAYNLLWRGDVERAKTELAAVHELGGDRQRGVAKAARCAEMPPEDAMACIR